MKLTATLLPSVALLVLAGHRLVQLARSPGTHTLSHKILLHSGTFPGYEHPDTSVLPKFRGGWPGDPELKETFYNVFPTKRIRPPSSWALPRPHNIIPPAERQTSKPTFSAKVLRTHGKPKVPAQWTVSMDITGHLRPDIITGESWVDIVYKPSASAPVSLEQIFNSTHTYVKHWRVDPGPTGSINHRGGALQQTHMIVHDPITVSSSSGLFWSVLRRQQY